MSVLMSCQAVCSVCPASEAAVSLFLHLQLVFQLITQVVGNRILYVAVRPFEVVLVDANVLVGASGGNLTHTEAFLTHGCLYTIMKSDLDGCNLATTIKIILPSSLYGSYMQYRASVHSM